MSYTHKETWVHRVIFVIKYTSKMIFIHVYVKVYMHVHADIRQGQKKESNSLELKIQGL